MPYMTSEYVALKAPEGTEERIPGKPDRYEYHNPGIDVLLCSKAFFDNNQQAWLQYADFLFALNLEKGLILKKCEINHYFEFEARVVYERKDPDLKSALNQLDTPVITQFWADRATVCELASNGNFTKALEEYKKLKGCEKDEEVPIVIGADGAPEAIPMARLTLRQRESAELAPPKADVKQTLDGGVVEGGASSGNFGRFGMSGYLMRWEGKGGSSNDEDDEAGSLLKKDNTKGTEVDGGNDTEG